MKLKKTTITLITCLLLCLSLTACNSNKTDGTQTATATTANVEETTETVVEATTPEAEETAVAEEGNQFWKHPETFTIITVGNSNLNEVLTNDRPDTFQFIVYRTEETIAEAKDDFIEMEEDKLPKFVAILMASDGTILYHYGPQTIYFNVGLSASEGSLEDLLAIDDYDDLGDTKLLIDLSNTTHMSVTDWKNQ